MLLARDGRPRAPGDRRLQVASASIDRDEVNEAVAFLEWLAADNFTFLGIREHVFVGGASRADFSGAPSRDSASSATRRSASSGAAPPRHHDAGNPRIPAAAGAADHHQGESEIRVHRRVHMDYVGVKLTAQTGELAGELRLVGLFTSTAYTQLGRGIPYLRGEGRAGRSRAPASIPSSHSGKALIMCSRSSARRTFPDRRGFALRVAHRHPRASTSGRGCASSSRRDSFDRFVSVFVFVPRDRYDSMRGRGSAAYLADVFDGHSRPSTRPFPKGR